MADRPLRRLFWRAAGDLDYLWTLATLRMLDALAGPLPETPADEQRARDRERIKRASPRSSPEANRPRNRQSLRVISAAVVGYRRLSMAI
jgi:hypothetical protein